MQDLLKNPKLRLFYTRDKLILSESFESAGGWNITGDWHVVTVETNVDRFLGLSGDIMLECAGSYNGGAMSKTVECGDYSEIIFEHCVKNGGGESDRKPNLLTFCIDGVEKLRVEGPSPWQRIVPVGLTPGRHEIRFTYEFDGSPGGKAGIVDNVVVWQARGVPCLITDYKPPAPMKKLGSSKNLRGFTRYQEMSAADTGINFSAVFDGKGLHEFIAKSGEPFYFVDEFGICYRGIFPETITPASVALGDVYSVELAMVAAQKTGAGFC